MTLSRFATNKNEELCIMAKIIQFMHSGAECLPPCVRDMIVSDSESGYFLCH